MVEVNIEYRGELRCHAVHGPSGNGLDTDAPVDNQGRGETFSPTDLMATALGTCVGTIMAIAARKHGIELAGTRIHVEKHMSADPPRRIARLPVVVRVPFEIAAEKREAIEKAASHCPVHQSLHPDIDAPIEFVYQADAANSV